MARVGRPSKFHLGLDNSCAPRHEKNVEVLLATVAIRPEHRIKTAVQISRRQNNKCRQIVLERRRVLEANWAITASVPKFPVCPLVSLWILQSGVNTGRVQPVLVKTATYYSGVASRCSALLHRFLLHADLEALGCQWLQTGDVSSRWRLPAQITKPSLALWYSRNICFYTYSFATLQLSVIFYQFYFYSNLSAVCLNSSEKRDDYFQFFVFFGWWLMWGGSPGVRNEKQRSENEGKQWDLSFRGMCKSIVVLRSNLQSNVTQHGIFFKLQSQFEPFYQLQYIIIIPFIRECHRRLAWWGADPPSCNTGLSQESLSSPLAQKDATTSKNDAFLTLKGS